jgi:hypothetical protein
MTRKILIALGILIVLLSGINLVRTHATTAVYNKTVQIVDSLGNIMSGTASAVTAAANETVRVVDSTGHVLDSITGTPSGPCGGDLTGTFPDCTVADISHSNAGSAAFLTAPSAGSITGWEALEQRVLHSLPITTGPNQLACTTTAGGYPSEDDYTGTLGAVNVTEALPTSGCLDSATIVLIPKQGANAVTLTVTGTKQGSELWSIGSSVGNKITLIYQYDATANAWLVLNPGTYPVQAFPTSIGGTGTTSTLTGVMRGGASYTAAEMSGDCTTSGSNALNCSKMYAGAVTFSNPPKISNYQYLATGATSVTLPTGSTFCVATLAGAGAGGNGVVVTGSAQTACEGASGASGARIILDLFPSTTGNGPFTITVGAAGNAGTNDPTTPTGGTNGTDSTITISSKAFTAGGGHADSTQENSACNQAGSAGSAGTAPSINATSSNNVPGVSIANSGGGSVGLAGAAGSTVQSGGSGLGSRGGPGGAVGAGGAAVGAPGAGDPGFMTVECYGGSSY